MLVAFVAYVAMRSLQGAAHWRSYGWVAAGAAIAPVPNLLFLLESPRDLLFRGSYVLPDVGKLLDTAASFLLPVHDPARYRALSGESFFFDGVGAAFARTGLEPGHPIASALLLCEAWACRRRWREPGVQALLAVWVAGCTILGPGGPGLTRFLFLLPVYLAVAGMGAAELTRCWKAARPVVTVALLAVAALHGRAYFDRIPEAPGMDEDYGARTAPLGLRARALAEDGRSVACLVTQQASVVRYLTHGQGDLVRIVEFHHRVFDPAEVARGERPAVLLLEAALGWQRVADELASAWRIAARGAGYVELHARRGPPGAG